GESRLRARLYSARLSAFFEPLVGTLKLIGVLAVIGLGTWQMALGHLTLGGLMAFMGYLSGLYKPVRSLSKLVNTVYSASAGAERISELLTSRSSVQERADARAIGCATGIVELNDVGFTYPGAQQPVLEAVSVRAEPGQVLALV